MAPPGARGRYGGETSADPRPAEVPVVLDRSPDRRSRRPARHRPRRHARPHDEPAHARRSPARSGSAWRSRSSPCCCRRGRARRAELPRRLPGREVAVARQRLRLPARVLGAFALPDAERHRMLTYGIVLALVLRGLFIVVGAAALSAFGWVSFVFAAFLIWTGWKLFRHRHDHDAEQALVEKVKQPAAVLAALGGARRHRARRHPVRGRLGAGDPGHHGRHVHRVRRQRVRAARAAAAVLPRRRPRRPALLPQDRARGAARSSSARSWRGRVRRQDRAGDTACPRSPRSSGRAWSPRWCASAGRRRRRPESNRCKRLCRPLRSHSATAPGPLQGTHARGRIRRSSCLGRRYATAGQDNAAVLGRAAQPSGTAWSRGARLLAAGISAGADRAAGPLGACCSSSIAASIGSVTALRAGRRDTPRRWRRVARARCCVGWRPRICTARCEAGSSAGGDGAGRTAH